MSSSTSWSLLAYHPEQLAAYQYLLVLLEQLSFTLLPLASFYPQVLVLSFPQLHATLLPW